MAEQTTALKMISVADAAKLSGYSSQTILRWGRDPLFPELTVFERDGIRPRVNEAQFIEFIKSMGTK